MIFSLLFSCSNKQAQVPFELFAPPKAEHQEDQRTILGTTILEPYLWLATESQETIEYIEAENIYTQQKLKNLTASMDILNLEMERKLPQIQEPISIVDGWRYEVRYDNFYAQHYFIENGERYLFLDENLLARGKSDFELRAFASNPSKSLLAYSYNNNANNEYVIDVFPVTKRTLPLRRIRSTNGDILWVDDNRFYFTALNSDGIEKQIKLLDIENEKETLIFQELEDVSSCRIWKSKSGRYIFISSSVENSNEVFLFDLQSEEEMFELLTPRQDGVEYWPVHFRDKLFYRSNYNAEDFRLFSVDPGFPDIENWSFQGNIIDGEIQSLEAFEQFMIISSVKDDLDQLYVFSPHGKVHQIPFPQGNQQVYQVPNRNFKGNTFRFGLSSIAAPLEIYEYSIENDSLSRIVQQEMDGFDSQEYRSHPLQLDSEQGALVSMNLLFKDTALPKEPKPLVLVPYSSDQELVENSFAIDRLSLLDRGVLYANCKVRGSVENSDWLLSGVENNQLDTVSDLKACIQQLFHMRITTPKMLSLLASGDSAMAVGSIMNSHPDWFQAVVLMNTVMDPLSQLELSSISTQQLEFVLSYSPYSTIKKQPYPAILFLDENTNHSPNLPWIAMMRTNRDIRLYYQTVESSNHNAISYAFLLSQLGVAVLP